MGRDGDAGGGGDDARPRARAASPGLDALLLVVALAAVSTSGPLIAATAVPALAIAFWRNALAGVVLVPAVLLRRRAELRGLIGRERRLALLAGALLALHFAVWIPSLRYTSVASATALVATQPVWAALLTRLRGQHVSRRGLDRIGVAVAARCCCRRPTCRCRGVALVGDVMAVAGGAFAAGYMVVGSEVRRSVSTTTYTALCYVTTALLLLPVCLLGRQALTGYDARRLAQAARPHRRRAAARPLAVQHGPAVGQPDGRQPVDPVRDPRGGAHRRAVPRPDAAAAGAARGRRCSWSGSALVIRAGESGRRVPVE